VNWANPLSNKLVGCWLFNELGGNKLFDIVNKNDAYMNGCSWKNGSVSLVSASGDYIYNETFPKSYITSACTILLIGKTTPGATNGGFSGRNTNNSGFSFDTNEYSNSGFLGYTQRGSWNAYSSIPSPFKPSVVSFSILSGRKTIRYAKNGFAYERGAEYGTAISTPNLDGFVIGGTYTGSYGASYNGFLNGCFVWNRSLSLAELSSVTGFPYQFFQKPTKCFYSLASGTTQGPLPSSTGAGIMRLGKYWW
jgi:hypothetical protein